MALFPVFALTAACSSDGAAIEGCATNLDCGADARCVDGECRPVDAPSGPCGGATCEADEICVADQCVPVERPTACGEDTDCGPPASICQAGLCVAGCGEPGGLACDEGEMCDPTTGRCEAVAGGCRQDAECGPPSQVCEAGTCVNGCGQPGGLACGAGEVCNTETGRCERLPGPCMGDAECGPPASICVSGQCIPGCGEIGGLQCTGQERCDAATGRCVSDAPPCTQDTDCAPPSTICNVASGRCEPGCTATGCPTEEVCNATTGRCEPKPKLPLDAPCTTSDECDSAVCFDLGGSAGPRCVKACGSASECPSGFTCYDNSGANLCVSSSHFSTATFADPDGSLCILGGTCASNFCYRNECTRTCREDADCGGTRCGWLEYSTDLYAASCVGSLGTGTNGSTCAVSADCASGVCYGTGICGDLCGASDDCPQGNVCGSVDYSTCLLELLGACLQWDINLVHACVEGTHGSDPAGTACVGGGTNCRGGFCLTGSNVCSTICARDADCPPSMVCGVESQGSLDGEPLFTTACVPR